MKKQHFLRSVAVMLAAVMLLGMLPAGLPVFAKEQPETVFTEDFEKLDKVWVVDPSYKNTFLTEGNDGTYDYMRLNATVSGNKGGAHSYAIPVTAGETYTVQLTYKTSKYLTVYTYSRDNTDVIGGTPIHSSNWNIDKGTDSWITRSFDYTVADGASYMNIMVFFMAGNAPGYADFRKITVKNKATGALVEDFAFDRGWNYYSAPATDGTHSISYGQLHSYNSTNVANFKTGEASNGLRSPVIPVTAGEEYQVKLSYSSHKNTKVQIEYWDDTGVTSSQWSVTKYDLGGYNGFKSQDAISTTAPEGARYMTLLFHDQYYNLFVDDISVSRVLPCDHENTETVVTANGNETHTVTAICDCGEVVSTKIAACFDGEDTDALCDFCGYELTVEILYEENFDSCTDRIDLTKGTNTEGAAAGWIYSQKSAKSYAYIENGKLYFAGYAYDVLYLDGGETWGNYTVEADMTYNTDNAGWAGLLYNVQSDTKFQKGGLSYSSKKISLNGFDGSGWTNNDTQNAALYADYGIGSIGVGTQYRLKIKVTDNTATIWYAQYTDGVLGDWIETLTIDNIYEDAQTGSIGFLSSSGILGSVVIDNIKVYSTSKVSFTENFDDYGDVTLNAGSNAGASGAGIYFQKNGNTSAYIKDGRLYLDASNGTSDYDQLYFLTGMNWTNYTVEADYGFANLNGWSGLLYRAVSGSSSQKAGVSPYNWNASLNGFTSKGNWVNNETGINNGIASGITVAADEPFRIRVVVKDSSAELWLATYDNGVLGAFNKVMAIDNIPDAHLKGSIGLMLSPNGTNATWIDNIVVSRDPELTVEAPETVNVADIYVPQTGIVNPPTVIQNVTSALPESSGKTPAVAIMEIDSSLNILDASGNVIATASEFAQTCGSTVIPAYVVDSQAEADALAQYFSDNGVIDAYVVADSDNAALVKSVRALCGSVRGALIFDDLTTLSARQSARELVVNNMAYVAISKAALDADAIEYFNTRQIAVWSYASDAAGVYNAISAGYTGVISAEPATVYDVYESITETTVSGKPVIIAHRGYAKEVPENTLAAIQAAIDLGCQAVEIDLRISSDGVLILDHDGILTRTTDYEERTDEFTKGQYTAAYTFAELKKLNVDYMGGTYQIASFEEVLAEFAGKVVLYCHINGDGKAAEYKWLTEEFNKLVEQYSAQDSVVYFSTYGYIDNVTSGIPIVAGQSGLTDLYAPTDELQCVENFISTLTPNHYQPLFYAYEGHQNEDFYYRLTARGFVNSHSVTDGQATLNSTLLTGCGAVGTLTNDPDLTADYAYQVLAEDAVVATGKEIDTTHNIAKLLGVTEQVSCDFVQLSGPALAATDTGYAATEAGDIQLVFYTTVTAPGGDSYRIYSQPVTYTVKAERYDILWNVALGDDLDLNFYVNVADAIADTAYIHITADGQTQSYKVSEQTKNEDGYYAFAIQMAAAQMTDKVTLQVTADGFEGDVHTYSVAKYAETVLGDGSYSEYHALVKEMLSYGAAAQVYFGYSAGSIDESLYEGAGSQEISGEDVADVTVSGDAEGITFYGASLLFKSKTAVRFYFTGDLSNYTFEGATVGQKNDLSYVEFANINPQDLDEAVTVTVGELTVSYSPMNYMVRMSQKGSDNLKALLKAMYNYHLAAKAFAERVILSDFTEAPEGKENLALTATASASDNVVLQDSSAKQLNEGDRTWSAYRPAESLEGQTDYYYLTWSEAVSFDQVVLFNQYSGQAPTAWTIAVTTDGESWREIGSVENVSWTEDQLEGKALIFPQQENIIGLRLQIVDANLIWGAYTIYEVEVY